MFQQVLDVFAILRINRYTDARRHDELGATIPHRLSQLVTNTFGNRHHDVLVLGAFDRADELVAAETRDTEGLVVRPVR